MLLPTPRAALLLVPGVLLALAAPGTPGLGGVLLGLDAALVALVLLDAALAPGPGAFRARRRVREPLTGFAPNAVALSLAYGGRRPVRLDLADAPPAGFDAVGHRRALRLAPGASAEIAYEVTPRARGRARFGDLHLRARGPLGLGARRLALPLAREVPVYPDLRAGAAPAGPGHAEPGRIARGRHEGREFRALRPYLPGDDARAIDWKATARRGAPVVREWQPERNQTVWILLDCGRHLSARLADGRTTLDNAVDAALALARTAVAHGDRAGAVLFGAEVDRVVPPGAGPGALAALAEALHLAAPRLEEPDWGAALEAVAARQRRRALVVILTDLGDPDGGAELLARAARLRRRHLVLVAAVADAEVAAAAAARPRDADEAFERAAAERLVADREAALTRLSAAAIRVASVPATELAAALVSRYLDVKARGAL